MMYGIVKQIAAEGLHKVLTSTHACLHTSTHTSRSLLSACNRTSFAATEDLISTLATSR